MTVRLTIDGTAREAHQGEALVDVITRAGGAIPHVCYHPQLGAIQTCDTCMVDVNGQLVRACATTAVDGMVIQTASAAASAAQVEAFDRILSNHLLYCTVCDNNNGNCTVHNTTKLLAIEHQRIPFQSKPYEVDDTNPFYGTAARRFRNRAASRAATASPSAPATR
jgi:formate dehydrogenase major subunit